jgi:hypothetical protein
MFHRYCDPSEEFDTAREEREREEQNDRDAAAFAAMSENDREAFLENERLAFLADERRRAPLTMSVACIGNGLFVRVGKRKVA